MDEKYLEILSKNILNDVKSYVKHNNIYLEEDKEIDVDKKMLEIIKSIVINDKENIFEKKEEEKDKKKEINSNIMPSLIQYYVALYNENLDLLHKLLDDKFSFGNYKSSSMNLFVLDKGISSKFELDEYVKLLKDNVDLFRNFYYSLNQNRDNKEININQIIDKFCNIIKKDNNIAISKKAWQNRCNRLFTIDFLINFTEEEILNLTDIQKDMLNGFGDYKDKGTELKLKFIKEYNYSKHIIWWDRFAEYFTEEEVLNLSQKDIKLFEALVKCGCGYDDPIKIEEIAINKLKEIKKINPNFNIALNSFVYNTLSIEQILAMSEKCVDKINNLCSIYEINQLSSHYRTEISEKTLKYWIKETYYKDVVTRNVKKIVKTK